MAKRTLKGICPYCFYNQLQVCEEVECDSRLQYSKKNQYVVSCTECKLAGLGDSIEHAYHDMNMRAPLYGVEQELHSLCCILNERLLKVSEGFAPISMYHEKLVENLSNLPVYERADDEDADIQITWGASESESESESNMKVGGTE